MTQLAIQSFGVGVPLVLFHGWGFDRRIWHAILPDVLALPVAHQLILVDLPGFGGSPMSTWSEFKENILADLPTQFILGGWSLGGLFATRLASEAPHRVKQLLQIASSPCFIQNSDWPGISPELLDDFYQRFMLAPQETRQQFVRSQLGSGQPNMNSLAEYDQCSGLHEGLLALKSWDLRANVLNLTTPIAYLFGRLDRIVPYKTMTSLQNKRPQDHYTLFQRAAHMPFLSHRKEFIDWLKVILC